MNNILYLSSGKYTYKVTYNIKSGLPKYRTYDRKLPKIRPPCAIYFDKHDNLFKEIIYPKELHNIELVKGDPVEEYIDSITGFVPDWTKIEIE